MTTATTPFNRGFTSAANLATDLYPVTSVETMDNVLNGYKARSGYDKAIISDGTIVNVVSNSYGHVDNRDFFLKVEEKLIEEGIQYLMRGTNRENRSFALDIILDEQDSATVIHSTKGNDIIRPMLRFVNSYDGSCKLSGSCGIYREVCTNGLHVAQSKLEFSFRKRGTITEVLMPSLQKLVAHFISSEFHELRTVFNVLAETPVTDISEYVAFLAKESGLFKYAASATNPLPSLNGRIIEETIAREVALLGTPNKWIVYNAFNALIHDKLKKPFDQQKKLDRQILDLVIAN